MGPAKNQLLIAYPFWTSSLGKLQFVSSFKLNSSACYPLSGTNLGTFWLSLSNGARVTSRLHHEQTEGLSDGEDPKGVTFPVFWRLGSPITCEQDPITRATGTWWCTISNVTHVCEKTSSNPNPSQEGSTWILRMKYTVYTVLPDIFLRFQKARCWDHWRHFYLSAAEPDISGTQVSKPGRLAGT